VTVALALLVAYVVGAVPVGFMVARAIGVGDIRRQGSGNIGATNVLRAAGRVAALVTLAGDIIKGWSAVALGALIEPQAVAPCAVAAVVGNCWSVFLRFRGGKGVATGLGAFLYLVPRAVLPAVPVWLIVTMTFRYVSLGSLLAAVCVPLGGVLLGYPRSAVAATGVVAAIVVVRHRENIARLFAGTERRLGEKRSGEAA